MSINGISIMSTFKSMFSNTEKFIGSVSAGIVSIFAPVCVPVIGLTFIILLDAIYGYQVSKKYGHKAIESRKAWKTIYKIRDAVTAILGAHIIDQYIVTSLDLHAVEFIAGAMSLVEFWSLLESQCELHPKWKIWRFLKTIIKAKGEKYLDVNLEKELSDDTNNNRNS